MRRNCPHCGVDQTLSDDKLNAGWVILKCHQCDGTSAVLGKASQQLARAAEKSLRSPKVMVQEQVMIQEPEIEITEEFTEPTPQVTPEPIHVKERVPTIPEFLKVDSKQTSSESEPQIFKKETHQQESQKDSPILVFVEEEKPEAPNWKSRARTYALPTTLALICFASGSYLLRTVNQLKMQGNGFASDVLPAENPAVATNQVPVTEPAAVASPAPREINRAPAVVSRIDLPKPAEPQEDAVTVAAKSVILRSGPGTQFNKVGMARAELQLLVKGSYEDWLEVRTGKSGQTAWIRRDLVKPLHEVAASKEIE